jgi:hypothetical protein
MKNKALIASLAVLAVLTMLFSSVYIAFAVPPVPIILDPKTIPKYVNQLVANIPVLLNQRTWRRRVIRQDYTIDMTHRRQILPQEHLWLAQIRLELRFGDAGNAVMQ